MADKTEALRAELDKLDKDYQANFAGKSRAQVDPSMLEKMIKRAETGLTEVQGLGAVLTDDALEALNKGFEERKDMYLRELHMVKLAKEAGPTFEKFSRAGSEANIVFNRYMRHFAGQARETRDVGLLNELIEDLRMIRQRMLGIAGKKKSDAFTRDIELVTNNLEMYKTELQEVQKAQADGDDQAKADRAAAMANEQFAVYQKHFAGKARVSRRPALLKRIIDNLKRIRTTMFQLKQGGFSSDSNDSNIGIVDDRIKTYERELEEIRKVRKGARLSDIMGTLGQAANDLFAEYRQDFAGRDRTTVSADQIGRMIDELEELRRQMVELGRVEKNEPNEKNQEVVIQQLIAWVNESNAIRQVQSEQ